MFARRVKKLLAKGEYVLSVGLSENCAWQSLYLHLLSCKQVSGSGFIENTFLVRGYGARLWHLGPCEI